MEDHMLIDSSLVFLIGLAYVCLAVGGAITLAIVGHMAWQTFTEWIVTRDERTVDFDFPRR